MIIVSGRYPDRLPEIVRYSLKDMEQAEKMANEMAYVGFVDVMIGDKPFKATRKPKAAPEGEKITDTPKPAIESATRTPTYL